MKSTPTWVNKDLYPFTSRWIEIDGASIHYIDEGKGDVILFVHGTPEWSFGFRDQVKALSSRFRCIAVDHLGFGLSDKPSDADYTCVAHSRRLETFINELRLKNISLVANDFGGGIALAYAIKHASNIRTITLFNTWMWSLREDPHFMRPTGIINSWLGRFMYYTLNAPVNLIMPSAFGDKKKLTREVHRHYKDALPNRASRKAAYTIATELIGASVWWQSLWDQMSKIEHLPILIVWGMKDKFVPPSVLKKWKERLPQASYRIFENAGHFVQEEEREFAEVVADFQEAHAGTPISSQR